MIPVRKNTRCIMLTRNSLGSNLAIWLVLDVNGSDMVMVYGIDVGSEWAAGKERRAQGTAFALRVVM